MSWEVRHGDVMAELALLASGSVDCIVTSPPYWGLRDYGVPEAWGLEPTLGEYLDRMRSLGQELLRVLKPSGTFWLNMGDAYAGSWGAQGRGDKRTEMNAGGRAGLSEEQIRQHPKRVQTGASWRTHLKDKDLIGMPWRVAFALQEQGWYLRSDIIWAKPNPMPESVTDRPTRSHEYVFLLTKNKRYWYDADAISEPVAESTIVRLSQPSLAEQKGSGRAHAGAKTNGTMKAVKKRSVRPSDTKGGGQGNGAMTYPTDFRNARTVWEITTQPYPEAHFATFPTELPKRCILAGCPEGGLVLDPFAGSGTTLEVAVRLGRNAVGIELNPDYIRLIEARMKTVTPSLFGSATQGGTG